MQVGLVVGRAVLVDGQVEVDDQIDVLDVDAARRYVRRDEHFGETVAESLNHARALHHVQLAAQQLARYRVIHEAHDQFARRLSCLYSRSK